MLAGGAGGRGPPAEIFSGAPKHSRGAKTSAVEMKTNKSEDKSLWKRGKAQLKIKLVILLLDLFAVQTADYVFIIKVGGNRT